MTFPEWAVAIICILAWWVGTCFGWKMRGWLGHINNDADVMP